MIGSRNAIRGAAPGVFRGFWRGLQYRSRLWFDESPATEIELKGSRRRPVIELSLVRGFVARSSSVHGQICFWGLRLRVLTLSSIDSSWFYALIFIGLSGIPPYTPSTHILSTLYTQAKLYIFHIRRVVFRQNFLGVLRVQVLGFNWTYTRQSCLQTQHVPSIYLEFQLLDLHPAVHA